MIRFKIIVDNDSAVTGVPNNVVQQDGIPTVCLQDLQDVPSRLRLTTFLQYHEQNEQLGQDVVLRILCSTRSLREVLETVRASSANVLIDEVRLVRAGPDAYSTLSSIYHLFQRSQRPTATPQDVTNAAQAVNEQINREIQGTRTFRASFRQNNQGSVTEVTPVNSTPANSEAEEQHSVDQQEAEAEDDVWSWIRTRHTGAEETTDIAPTATPEAPSVTSELPQLTPTHEATPQPTSETPDTTTSTQEDVDTREVETATQDTSDTSQLPGPRSGDNVQTTNDLAQQPHSGDNLSGYTIRCSSGHVVAYKRFTERITSEWVAQNWAYKGDWVQGRTYLYGMTVKHGGSYRFTTG